MAARPSRGRGGVEMSLGDGPEESMFRNSGLIGYLVKRLNETYPGKQIGKTIIQKIMYLLSRSDVANFSFSMYHYGPYSSEVSGELNFAERNGIVDISWKDAEGYYINPTEKGQDFEHLLSDGEKRAVDDMVARFGKYKAIDLSLIATALYLKDNFDVEEDRLVEAVHNAKKKFSPEYIRSILEGSGVLSD